MPADLEQLFGALGTYVDTSSTGGAGPARQRGQQRTRRRLTATFVAIVLLIGAVTVAMVRFARPDHPPANPRPTQTVPARPVAFTPLRQVGPGLNLDLAVPNGLGTSGYGMASVVGDRAYVAALTKGHLLVNALDLDTGKPLWSTVDVGSYGDWNGLIAGDEAVVVIGEHDDGSSPDHVLTVLDPDTGAKRWSQGFDALDIEWYTSVAVVPDPAHHVVRGLDWRTGATKWTIDLPADGPEPTWLQNFSTRDATVAPVRMRFGVDPSDQRLFRLDHDGTLRVYDAATGRQTEQRTGVGDPDAPGPSWSYLIFDDVLYANAQNPINKVDLYDLAGSGPMTTVYQAPAGRYLRAGMPCGGNRICAVTAGTGAVPERLVALDRASHRVLWEADVGYVQSVSGTDDHVLTDRGELFDADGHRLGSQTEQQIGWINPASLLTFASPGPTRDAKSTVAVTGLSTRDGTSVPLGQIPLVSGFCSWNQRLLVCPTVQGFRVWSFA